MAMEVIRYQEILLLYLGNRPPETISDPLILTIPMQRAESRRKLQRGGVIEQPARSQYLGFVFVACSLPDSEYELA